MWATKSLEIVRTDVKMKDPGFKRRGWGSVRPDLGMGDRIRLMVDKTSVLDLDSGRSIYRAGEGER